MTRQDAAALAEPARSRVRVPPPRDARDDTSSAAEPATGSAKTAERSEGGMSEEERRELRALVQRRLGDARCATSSATSTAWRPT